MYFSLHFLIYSRTWIGQNKYMYIVMITKDGSIKIIIFMTPRAGVLVLLRGHISSISEYALIILYNTFIVAYSMMGLLKYKYEPFWQEVSVKCLILSWPLKSLVSFSFWIIVMYVLVPYKLSCWFCYNIILLLWSSEM